MQIATHCFTRVYLMPKMPMRREGMRTLGHGPTYRSTQVKRSSERANGQANVDRRSTHRKSLQKDHRQFEKMKRLAFLKRIMKLLTIMCLKNGTIFARATAMPQKAIELRSLLGSEFCNFARVMHKNCPYRDSIQKYCARREPLFQS